MVVTADRRRVLQEVGVGGRSGVENQRSDWSAMDAPASEPGYLSELSDLVFSEQTLDSMLLDVGLLALRAIPEADAATTMVLRDDVSDPVHSWTDEFAREV